VWQTQPTLAETECPYNWDLMSIPPIPGQERSVMEIMMEDHRPTITVPYLLADKSDPARYQEDLDEANWLHDYLPNVDSVEEVLQPLSDFAYPIFANSHERIQFNTDGHHGKDEHAVVALFSASVYWKDQIRDILPEGSAGILVVFESECASSFTYEVNGPNVVYLGTGDHSDSKYDYMTQGALVSDLRFYSTKNSTYSGLLLEDSYCPIYVSIHASEKMEAIYKTSTPWIFAVVTACVFLLTVLTFMFYNYVVEKRQKVVLKSAVASNAIVSSLFPETVKRQLEMQAKEQLGDDTLPKGKLSSFLNDGNDKEAAKNTKQIAELFPETTVLFADIAGFTAWASSREPSHVFTLLEALYGAFDLQAKKMGKFGSDTENCKLHAVMASLTLLDLLV
jgi:Adenylate and Guanylate cyclase catalytic domain